MLPNYGPSGFHFLAFAPFLMVFLGIGVLITIIPYWFIFKKAGFSPWLCVLMFLPLVNLIVLYVVAFSQWKVVSVPYGYPVQQPPPPTYYPPQG
jgi:hypothetical protein